MKNNLVNVDIDKISEILNVTWKYMSFDDIYNDTIEHIDKNAPYFYMESKHGRLQVSVNKKSLSSISVAFDNGFSFRFESITRVEYIYHNHMVIFESLTSSQLSTLWISRNGYVHVKIGISTKEHGYERVSAANTFTQEQSEIDKNQGKSYFERYIEEKKSK